MNTRLFHWVEVAGIAAVVISLGLLTWELNQANRLATYNVNSDIYQHFNQMNLQTATSTELATLWADLVDENADLSNVDIQRALGLAYFLRAIWENTERAYDEGLIDYDIYQTTLNDIRGTAIAYPGLNPYLRVTIELLEDGRELSEVERLILEVTD